MKVLSRECAQLIRVYDGSPFSVCHVTMATTEITETQMIQELILLSDLTSPHHKPPSSAETRTGASAYCRQ